MRFLLIDDNPDDRELARLQLAGRFPDAEFVEVGRLDELEPALARGGHDLIFLDYYLRWGNGLDVLRAIKARSPDVPVVMLTDSGSEEIAIEGMKAGLCDYVLKSRLRRLAAVAEDCLERARLRREHREARDRLAATVGQLTEADRRKDEFLAMLGHELRNPLAPVLNALHLIRLDPHDAGSVLESAEVAERQVRHMARLLDDLLDASRVARGVITLREETVDLASAIGRAVEAVRPLVEARGQSLAVSPPPRPVAVRADPARMVQVFVNLLTNAARYTDPGGSIRVEAERSGGLATFRVLDSGIGIEPALLPRVFDLFLQGRRDSARSEGGLGIGLTLVKHLVELHGGTVEAHSDGPGLGSEFVVRLPAIAPSPGTAEAPGPVAPPSPPERPWRVLVVDDNRDAARSLSRLLKLWNYDPQAVHDGTEALSAAETHRPDVILLDLGLPGLGGIEVAEALRGRPEFRDTSIIALTGYGQESDRERTQRAGFDAHLVKPVNPDELRDRLAKLKIGRDRPA